MADSVSMNMVNKMRDAAESLDTAANKIPQLIEQIVEEVKPLGIKKADDALAKLSALFSEDGYIKDLKSTGDTLTSAAGATEKVIIALGGDE